MKIFIDDERIPPRGEEADWVIVRDPKAAFAILHANSAHITHISFDNDLGFETEGRDIMQQVLLGTPVTRPVPFPRLEAIYVHSANTVAAQAMLDLAASGKKSGIIRKEVIIEGHSALYEKYQTFSSWYDEAYEAESERLDGLNDLRLDEHFL